MFNLIRNKTETRKLNKWYNKLMEKHITKEQYKEIVKEDNLYAKYLKKKFYAIQEGMYPIRNGITSFKKQDITECGIYDFFKIRKWMNILNE